MKDKSKSWQTLGTKQSFIIHVLDCGRVVDFRGGSSVVDGGSKPRALGLILQHSPIMLPY